MTGPARARAARAVAAFVSAGLVLVAADSLASVGGRGYAASVSLGIAPVTRFSAAGVSESGLAPVFGFTGGLDWGRRDQVVVQWSLSVRHSDHFTALGRGTTHLDGSPLGDLRMWQTFLGLGWWHYLRDGSRSPYANVAAGLHTFSVDDLGQNGRGFGCLLGAGYQFAPHLQAGLFVLLGRTGDFGVDYDHTQVGCLLSWIRR